MWMKWLPWRFLVSRFAKDQGFLDPFRLISQLQRFAQPSEVAIPIEIVRLASVLHARGLMNSQVIQHNLDWVWPYWVERQFDPKDPAFIPRAFSVSHINLTHRNWTAVGIPDCDAYPIVDPAGLVTPLADSWSIDSWIVFEDGEEMIPSRLTAVSQRLWMSGNLAVWTERVGASAQWSSRAEVAGDPRLPVCRIRVKARAGRKAWCVISLRPYNPEGVSFVHRIDLEDDPRGWKVNGRDRVLLSPAPERCLLSDYKKGDVYHFLPQGTKDQHVVCDAGMATAAVAYELKPEEWREIAVEIPLKGREETSPGDAAALSGADRWAKSLEGACRLKIPDAHFQFLYDAALRSIVLHAPGEVYPGPYTYKHFWFRDAAFILHALLCAGLSRRAGRAIEASFFSRQTPFGYFHSQDGEWDSNGQALWILNRFCELTETAPKSAWKEPVEKAARWIVRKRLPGNLKEAHAGLLPAGFSAEHLGPNDYYYWDDFWGVAGLAAARDLAKRFAADSDFAAFCEDERASFLAALERSLWRVQERLGHRAMPASPYRRMDTGAVGSLAASYPLQIWEPGDPRLAETVEYLIGRCFVEGGFFHDMSHSGINPYLTLHIAQALLRAGDARAHEIMKAVAGLASPTGQWPEAVHPQTRGGCMGDGQHVWAAAEWILMIRNSFVREEGERLVLFSGIPAAWLQSREEIRFGPAPTKFGPVRLSVSEDAERVKLAWAGEWFGAEPAVEIALPGQEKIRPAKGQAEAEIPLAVRP